MVGSIIVGAVNVVGTLVAAFLMDHAGRRQLLLVSYVIMTVCLAGLAISTWLPCKHIPPMHRINTRSLVSKSSESPCEWQELPCSTVRHVKAWLLLIPVKVQGPSSCIV